MRSAAMSGPSVAPRSGGSIMTALRAYAFAAAALAAMPAAAGERPMPLAACGGIPTRVGQCQLTNISAIGSRLNGDPSSGTTVSYANGAVQISDSVASQVAAWQPGDDVTMCLAQLPQNCQPGDTRGNVYLVTDLRTRTSWQRGDAEHTCG
jgi:hypothetical protein